MFFINAYTPSLSFREVLGIGIKCDLCRNSCIKFCMKVLYYVCLTYKSNHKMWAVYETSCRTWIR